MSLTDMKWITRENVKVDRVACPWVIKKFVDPDAKFLFVPEADLLDAAAREGACCIGWARSFVLRVSKDRNLSRPRVSVCARSLRGSPRCRPLVIGGALKGG